MRTCDNPRCCNPEHRTVLLHSTQRTHCRNGHRLTEENTEIRGHSRNCRTCSSQSARAAARRKAASLAVLPATFRITDAQGQHQLASSWQDLKAQITAKRTLGEEVVVEKEVNGVFVRRRDPCIQPSVLKRRGLATFRITDVQGQHHLASSWQDLKEQLRAQQGQGGKFIVEKEVNGMFVRWKTPVLNPSSPEGFDK